jgi:hypothetical protein
MKDVVVIGVAKVGTTVAPFFAAAATNNYDEHIPYPTCLNPR